MRSRKIVKYFIQIAHRYSNKSHSFTNTVREIRMLIPTQQ